MSSIIISQNQQHSRRIDESSFGKEDSLQSYLYDNPDIIPIYDIDASELSRKGPVLPAKIMVQIVDKVIAVLDEFIKRKEKDENQ